MKLSEFKEMWEKDGFTFAKQDEQVRADGHWYLYNVHLPYGSSDYGRHMAILLQVHKETREVMAHDVKNTTSFNNSKPAPWTTEIQAWFNRHVREGGLA